MAKQFADYGIEVPASAHGEYRAICPKCSSSRKKTWRLDLEVNVEKGVWLCHHCGWSGGLGRDGVEHAQKVFKMPHFVESQITDKRVLAWFKARGITTDTLAAFKIAAGTAGMMSNTDGKWEKVVTMQFPYFFNGQCVNIKHRTSDKRFRQEKDARKVLFNYDMALAEIRRRQANKALIITEGEMDALALYEAGFHAVVSVPDGAPAPNAKAYTSKFDFLAESEDLISACDTYILAVDNDAPGITLRDELARRLGIEKCLRVAWPQGCKDANDVLLNNGREFLNQCIHEAEPFPIQGVKSGRDLWDALFELHGQEVQAGVEIGWRNTAEHFNVEAGQMTVVTGIPSHGKSTWIDALRVNLFKHHGWKSAAFSPENWPVQNHMALLCEMHAGRNFREMTTEELYEATAPIIDAFYFIAPEKDDDMMTVDAILNCARQLIFRHGIKVLVIDPWNEIEHHIPANLREDQYISEQLATIRRFARMNAIHVFLIAHPHMLQKDKDGIYPAPTAYDIAGGAMWYNKADNILCVYRPDMTTSDTKVFVQKIRFRRNGNRGEMNFKFHVDTSTYYDA